MKTMRDLAFAAMSLLVFAQGAAAQEFSDQQKQEIEKLIKEYLISNPEVIKEAIQELERRQLQAANEAAKKTIGERAKEIYRAEEDLVLGNAAGEVAVVEFFDYNCGYCKRAIPEIEKLIQSDKNVKVIIKEFPILGAGSIIAAKAALASRLQGKYAEFHAALTGFDGVKDEESVMQVATQLGLDVTKLKADMESDAVAEVIRRNYSLAEALSINGTPSFIIDDALEPGYVSFDVLAQHVATVRQNGGCKLC
ncbi:MAG TPA: DsbA family protein [Aestuariivirgaceae bacterium]|jgi:protein-disulfide isomerase